MECCNKQVKSKFCPDCGKQMQDQKAKSADQIKKLLNTEVETHELFLDKSSLGTIVDKSYLHHGIGTNVNMCFVCPDFPTNDSNSTKDIKFKLFDDLKIKYALLLPERKSLAFCSPNQRSTLEQVLIYLTRAKINNPVMNNHDAVFRVVSEGFKIVEYNPASIYEYRKLLVKEYFSLQRRLEELIDSISTDLYLMDNKFYTLEELQEMFDLKSNQFDIKFNINPHKVRNVTIYSLSEEYTLVYKRLQENPALKKAIEKILIPKQGSEQLLTYFNVFTPHISEPEAPVPSNITK